MRTCEDLARLFSWAEKIEWPSDRGFSYHHPWVTLEGRKVAIIVPVILQKVKEDLEHEEKVSKHAASAMF